MDKMLLMPCLSEKDLWRLSVRFGLFQEPGISKWIFFYDLLHYAVGQGRCVELLCYLFDLKQFHQLKVLGDIEKIKERHKEICKETIKRINAKLILTQHELRYADGHFHMVEFGKDI